MPTPSRDLSSRRMGTETRQAPEAGLEFEKGTDILGRPSRRPESGEKGCVQIDGKHKRGHRGVFSNSDRARVQERKKTRNSACTEKFRGRGLKNVADSKEFRHREIDRAEGHAAKKSEGYSGPKKKAFQVRLLATGGERN